MHADWLNFCSNVKQVLNDVDTSFPVDMIADIMKQNSGALFVSDVGNNGFWVARAYAYAFVSNRLLLSKSFAALGCSVPKAIGAYYSAHKPIICFTGDQGLLFNIQELHFIAENKLPITIVLLNNASSGMIYSIQKTHKCQNFIHTTSDGGYTNPNFKKIAKAFNVPLVEIAICKDIDQPRLPKGNLCYDFIPNLSDEKSILLERIRRDFYGNVKTNRP
jgi:acetolactate synthase-1/2/3 large subunit